MSSRRWRSSLSARRSARNACAIGWARDRTSAPSQWTRHSKGSTCRHRRSSSGCRLRMDSWSSPTARAALLTNAAANFVCRLASNTALGQPSTPTAACSRASSSGSAASAATRVTTSHTPCRAITFLRARRDLRLRVAHAGPSLLAHALLLVPPATARRACLRRRLPPRHTTHMHVQTSRTPPRCCHH